MIVFRVLAIALKQHKAHTILVNYKNKLCSPCSFVSTTFLSIFRFYFYTLFASVLLWLNSKFLSVHIAPIHVSKKWKTWKQILFSKHVLTAVQQTMTVVHPTQGRLFRQVFSESRKRCLRGDFLMTAMKRIYLPQWRNPWLFRMKTRRKVIQFLEKYA